MAKKKTKTVTNTNRGIKRGDIAQLVAFIALILSAIIWILQGISVLDKMGTFGNILRLIKDISLLVVIGLVSHNYAKRLGKVWYVIYWIIIVIAILGIVFGSFGLITI